MNKNIYLNIPAKEELLSSNNIPKDLCDDKTVFVRSHKELMNSSRNINTKKGLSHPLIIPFLGGKDRAEMYLDIFAKKIGTEMYLNIINDLGDVANGRWLVLGYGDFDYGFSGCCIFDDGGRVLGVESSDNAGPLEKRLQ